MRIIDSAPAFLTEKGSSTFADECRSSSEEFKEATRLDEMSEKRVNFRLKI